MIDEIKTLKDALRVAVKEEIKAHNLYLNLSKNVTGAGTKTMLKELAEQELEHQKLLIKIVEEDKYDGLGSDIPQGNRGIANFLSASELKEDATSQEVMIFAMKEEEKAIVFYTYLKHHFIGTELGKLFGNLAAEEEGHKIKLENEYDDFILLEN